MFIATIAGYLVATLFAFCGLVSIGHVLTDLSAIKSASEFVTTLAVAAWPLAVAVAIYLLTQIAGLLQRQGIMLSCVQTLQPPQPAPVAKVKKPAPVPPAQPAAADYFQAAPVQAPPMPPSPSVPQPPAEESPAPLPPARQKEVKETPNGLNFFRID